MVFNRIMSAGMASFTGWVCWDRLCFTVPESIGVTLVLGGSALALSLLVGHFRRKRETTVHR